MKPGRLTCAGLVAIMMVLPNTLWKGSPPQATVKVVVRASAAARIRAAGREPTRPLRDDERDPARPRHTPTPGRSY